MSDARLTDRCQLGLNRARAHGRPAWFLHDAVADEISERLAEINKSFTKPALVGHISPKLAGMFPDAARIDDSETLAFSTSYELVLHAFSLHWANDPVGQIVQSRLALEPDGLFLGVMFAGGTLQELRTCLAEAEAQLMGGLSPRVLPMGDLRDLGGLLQRSGLALPVADSHKITVRYRSLSALVADLRGMGEGNALTQRNRKTPPRDFFPLVEQIYRSHFADDEGYLLATFEIVYLTGWCPADNQQQPLRPGSAQARLADALGVPEIGSGDPATPDKP